MATCDSGWETHPIGGWRVRVLRCGQDGHTTVVRFVPSLGCNVIGLEVDGRDYLVDCEPDGRILGTPILYPTPNRVQNAAFRFDERVFRFPPNNGEHFIHGLVRAAPWEMEEPVLTNDGISLTAHIRMAPGTDAYELFPVRNTLSLRIEVLAGRLRLAFTIQNNDAERRLPFGLAVHPYFPIYGERREVVLHVPAQRWMEAKALLPTGRLLPPSACPADPTQPISLERLDLDDVFWGMEASRPATVDYGAIGKRLTLTADDWFTHAVVYTPPKAPYFCVENQSCSTDAHNLYARGHERAAHLTILAPGESLTASLSLAVTDL